MTPTDFRESQVVTDNHSTAALSEHTPVSDAQVRMAPTDFRESQVISDNHQTGALSELPGGLADTHTASPPREAILYDPTLEMAAAILDDLEELRKANANRLSELTRTGADADGIERGLGLPESDRNVIALSALVAETSKLEQVAVKNLEKVMKAHPLGPWVMAQKGVGLKQAARLLAAVRDPYVNDAKGCARTVSQLWAYCGLHVIKTDQDVGVAARRRKGHPANWSTAAKTRAWNIIDSCMKQIDRTTCVFEDGRGVHTDQCGCSPYRRVVDERRSHTTVTHPDWTPAHSLADGKRIAMKALLKDLWREARRIHQGDPS